MLSLLPQLAHAADFILPTYPTTTRAGQTTATLTMQVTEALASGVSITPSGAGLTFTPSGIFFAAGQTSANFTVTASANAGPGPVAVSYAVSGPDQGNYTAPSPNSFNVLGVITPPSYPNTADGSSTAPLSMVLSAAPPNGLTITPSASGVTFSPTTLTFGPGEIATPRSPRSHRQERPASSTSW